MVFLEVDLKYPDNIKEKTKCFPFSPPNKTSPQDEFSDNMIGTKPNKEDPKKVNCDWTDIKYYLIHYRLLEVYVWHGMVVGKVH